MKTAMGNKDRGNAGRGGGGVSKQKSKDSALLAKRDRLVAKDADLRRKFYATRDRDERETIRARMESNLSAIKTIDRKRSSIVGAETRARNKAKETPQDRLKKAEEKYRKARDAWSRQSMPSESSTRAYRKATDELRRIRAEIGR